MSNVKACPFRTYMKKVPGCCFGSEDMITVNFFACRKENCMAYDDGECMVMGNKKTYRKKVMSD